MRSLIPVSALLIVGLVGVVGARQQAPPAPGHSDADLRAKHPEIARNPNFQEWLKGTGVGPWYETAMDAQRRRTVVIQDETGDKLFAAQVSAADGAAVRQTAVVDLAARSARRTDAFAALTNSVKTAPANITRARPVVDFSDDGKWNFSWQFEVSAGAKVETYRLRDKKLQLEATRDRSGPSLPPPPAAAPAGGRGAGAAPPDPDPALAGNELHHPDMFRGEATTWTQGMTTVQDRARRVWDRVHDGYLYDQFIEHIKNFTWADVLTRDVHNRAGICDEHAVVSATYLRSLGIPARVIALSWNNSGNGQDETHEAVEYLDGTAWRHFDSLWGFNDPGVYRAQGMTNVLVMDLGDPRDSRSTADAYGTPDINGDKKLHPFLDFIVTPPYKGASRPGYSQ